MLPQRHVDGSELSLPPIEGPEADLDRLPHGGLDRLRALDSVDAGPARAGLREAYGGAEGARRHRGRAQLVGTPDDPARRIEPARNTRRVAVRGERPPHVAFEVRGHDHAEGPALAGSTEARILHDREGARLASVELGRLDEVVRAERDLDQLLVVPVHEAERERVGAVLVLVEAVEVRCDEVVVGVGGRQRKLPPSPVLRIDGQGHDHRRPDCERQCSRQGSQLCPPSVATPARRRPRSTTILRDRRWRNAPGSQAVAARRRVRRRSRCRSTS